MENRECPMEVNPALDNIGSLKHLKLRWSIPHADFSQDPLREYFRTDFESNLESPHQNPIASSDWPVMSINCKWLPSGVIKHGVLENPRADWNFCSENHWNQWSMASSTPCLMTPENINVFSIGIIWESHETKSYDFTAYNTLQANLKYCWAPRVSVKSANDGISVGFFDNMPQSIA